MASKYVSTALIFGDSNTWGYDPETKARYPYEVRWTTVLQEQLGDTFRVIPEGLNGRTTQHEDPTVECPRNGETQLLALLHSHKPIDVLVIALGVNDLKVQFNSSAEDVRSGIEKLIAIAQKAECGPASEPFKILVVCPPRVGILSDDFKDSFEGSHAKSDKIPALLKKICFSIKDCYCLDANDVVTADDLKVDGIHLSRRAHERLALAASNQIVNYLYH